MRIDNPKQREEAKEWLCQMAEKFQKAFAHRIQELDLSADDSNEEGLEDNG